MELQTVYYEQMQEDFDIRELKAWETIEGFYDAFSPEKKPSLFHRK